MKYLKPFNENIDNFKEELQDFCEMNLAYLLDEGTKIEIIDFPDNALIEIKKKDDEIRASQIKMDVLQASLKSSTEYKQKLDEVTGKLTPLPISGNPFQIEVGLN
jgi:hypothetical protein